VPPVIVSLIGINFFDPQLFALINDHTSDLQSVFISFKILYYLLPLLLFLLLSLISYREQLFFRRLSHIHINRIQAKEKAGVYFWNDASNNNGILVIPLFLGSLVVVTSFYPNRTVETLGYAISLFTLFFIGFLIARQLWGEFKGRYPLLLQILLSSGLVGVIFLWSISVFKLQISGRIDGSYSGLVKNAFEQQKTFDIVNDINKDHQKHSALQDKIHWRIAGKIEIMPEQSCKQISAPWETAEKGVTDSLLAFISFSGRTRIDSLQLATNYNINEIARKLSSLNSCSELSLATADNWIQGRKLCSNEKVLYEIWLKKSSLCRSLTGAVMQTIYKDAGEETSSTFFKLLQAVRVKGLFVVLLLLLGSVFFWLNLRKNKQLDTREGKAVTVMFGVYTLMFLQLCKPVDVNHIRITDKNWLFTYSNWYFPSFAESVVKNDNAGRYTYNEFFGGNKVNGATNLTDLFLQLQNLNNQMIIYGDDIVKIKNSRDADTVTLEMRRMEDSLRK
jgi:hypothetical protein